MDKVGVNIMCIYGYKYFDILFGIYLYILELQNGKYYVGITTTFKHRLMEHKRGSSTAFVRENLPVKSYKVGLLKSRNWYKCLDDETKVTMRLIRKKGFENVYGGAITGSMERRREMYAKYLDKWGEQ